jgi:hypothetical protein
MAAHANVVHIEVEDYLTVPDSIVDIADLGEKKVGQARARFRPGIQRRCSGTGAFLWGFFCGATF